MKAPAFSSPEPLETRIAPAAVFTFTDVDGDLVKITTSLGTNAELEAAATVVGGQLYLLDLTAAVFQNTNVSASVVTKSATGDGRVNLGRINATGRDLGSVTIAGDLGDLDCGDATTATTALKSLSVRSLGLFGLATQGGAGDLRSDISGPLGALTVAGDLHEVYLSVSAATLVDGRIGAITIGGSVLGGSAPNSGRIAASGDLGAVTIGRDVVGGADSLSGMIGAVGKVASITIGGSLIGGAGSFSGQLEFGGNVGPVKIGGDVVGVAFGSGRIHSGLGGIESVSIGGSLRGGAGESGKIFASTKIGPVKIGGNLIGGANAAGFINGGTIASVTIGGSQLGGDGPSSGTIFADADLGPVKIGGDLKGGAGNESGKIVAGGKIASVAIGGSLFGGGGDYDTILLGNFRLAGQIFAGGTLGLVKIGGDVQGGAGRESASIRSVGAMSGASIGGSLLGGAGLGSATLTVATVQPMGAVVIAHDLHGGAGGSSGRIVQNGGLAGVTIGGSLIGGTGASSGLISGRVGEAPTVFVHVGHDVLGGSGGGSGSIGQSKAVTIGGSLLGGTGDFTGVIQTLETDLESVSIGHDLLGGSIPGQSAALDASGYIECDQRIGRITIGGSIVSGTDGSGGVEGLTRNASIRAGRDIGAFTVVGGLIGNVTPAGESHVIISARGQATPGASTDVAIGKISIGGRVEWARILAGYDTALVPRNADAQIVSVTVGADFIASSIVAGAFNEGLDFAPGGSGLNADNVYFGNLADRKIVEAGELPGVAARIGSIAIAGQVYGTPESFEVEDQFGFVSEQIGALKVGARTYPLTAGSGNDAFPVNWRTDTLGFGPNLHEFDKLDIGFSASVNDSARRVTASLITYLDKDGDRAIVTFSKPLLTTDAIARDVFHFDTGMVGDAVQALQQLRYLDLRPLATNGLGVTITVLRGPVGDGLIHVGAIVSSGYDMGAIVVPGDLGQIAGGATTAGKPGLASLNVRTLGRLGLDTQGPAVAGFSPKLGGEINGGLGTLTVKEDIVGANLDIGGAIGPVNIGGSLIGGDDLNSGLLATTTTIGAVRIGDHLQGGFGQGSGGITSAGAGIASLSIGGSMLGAGGIGSGATFGGVTGLVQIGHNVRGGTNENSGTIGIEGGGRVTIGGSLLGGAGTFGARIVSDSGIGAVKVGHNVQGGAERSARIEGRSLASVTIGGSLLGGFGDTSGSLTAFDIGPVKIAHDLQGGAGLDSGKIDSGAALTSVSIGGSLLGGDGVNSGRLESETDTTLVTIGHNLTGGADSSAGSVFAKGRLVAVTLGGSLVGGSGSRAGGISADGGIGAAKIGRDVHGGSSVGESGSIFSRGGDLASGTIGGSLIGGAGFDSGEIFSTGDVGVVKIGGDVIGGAISDSGIIRAAGKLASATIGGSLIGGSSDFTGAILGAEIGAVSIGRNLVGGSIAGTTGTLDQSGYLESQNRLAAVTVGGSLFAGWDTSTAGSLTRNASIRAGDDLGAVVIRGSLHGHAGSPIIISATDEEATTATRNLAIKSLSIGGRVERALILAGYLTSVDAADTRTAFFDNTAQIGAVSVRGDWLASSLVAGILDFDNNGFGNGDDVLGVLGGGGATIAKIASIALGGVVAGTAAAGDHFGFTSVTIGSFKSLGYTAPLTAAANVIELSPTTGDVTIREV